MTTKITNYMGSPFDSINEAVKANLNGEEHDTGQLESIDATVDNIVLCLGDLVQLLVDKNIITEDEVETIVLKNLFA